MIFAIDLLVWAYFEFIYLLTIELRIKELCLCLLLCSWCPSNILLIEYYLEPWLKFSVFCILFIILGTFDFTSTVFLIYVFSELLIIHWYDKTTEIFNWTKCPEDQPVKSIKFLSPLKIEWIQCWALDFLNLKLFVNNKIG